MNPANYSMEETGYSFNELETEDFVDGPKDSKVHNDIAHLQRAVAALQIQVGQLFDERQSLKDDHDRLKRDNQRRIWEITKLQGENRDAKEKCNKIQQENLALKTKSTEFRLAINKLHATAIDHKEIILRLARILYTTLCSRT